MPVVGAVSAAAVGHALPSTAVLATFLPRQPERLGPIRLRTPATRAVALTFDDGPSPTETPRTLDLLDELGLRATFFLLGSGVAAHPELVAEIRQRGHGVGSHGMEHVSHLLRPPGWIARDLADSVAAIVSSGTVPRFFRPPYGQLTTATVSAARREHLEIVLWSAWGREFADREPDRVLARLVRRLSPGAILLLHDCDTCAPPGSAARTRAVLPLLAEELARRQLEAATLDELLA